MPHFLIYDIYTGAAQSSLSTDVGVDELSAALGSGVGVLEVMEPIRDTRDVVVAGGQVTAVQPEVDIVRMKTRALVEVNDLTGRTRLARATDGPFQSVAYELKRAEAEIYLSQNPPTDDLSDYPLLRDIAPIRGLSPAQLAQLWIDTNDAWTPVLARTEVIRDGAVFAIKAAVDTAGVKAAVEEFKADIAAILRE